MYEFLTFPNCPMRHLINGSYVLHSGSSASNFSEKTKMLEIVNSSFHLNRTIKHCYSRSKKKSPQNFMVKKLHAVYIHT